MPRDVLQHHDRVVDDESGGDGQRHQRKDVEAVAEQIHHAERAKDGDRHRHARDHGGAEVAEEQKHHGCHQQHRQHQRHLGIVQRGADCRAAIDSDTDVHVGRHRRFQMRQLGLHGVDGLDDVGVRLAVEDDQNRRLAVGHAEIAQILHRIGHLGDVAEANRRPIAIGDHQRCVIGGNVGLVVGVDLQAAVAVVDRALRAVGVGGGERGAHVLQPDAVIVERLRVELDAHRRKARAADIDVADAAQLRKPLRQNVAGGVVHLALRHRLRGQRQDHDRRVGRIDLPVDRIARQVGRQVGAGRVDRRFDVARGAVDVAADVELQGDTRLADAALRRHLGDGGDLAEVTLERLGDAGGDGLRTGARQRRRNRNSRKIHLRQRRYRQPREAEQPRQCDRKRQQRRRYRAGDEWGGDVHSAGSPLASGFAGRRPVRRVASRSKYR